jgi:hypothetical protein
MSDKSERTADDLAELAELRWHWDSAYKIDCDAGVWTARWTDGTDTLAAGTAYKLRALIRADYFARAATKRRQAAEAAMGAGERALRQLREDGVI